VSVAAKERLKRQIMASLQKGDVDKLHNVYVDLPS
jgi:hypothetical protein